MTQPPPWPPQPPPTQSPYVPPQAGYGNPHGGQPVPDNPYATGPQQPQQPSPYGAHPLPPQYGPAGAPPPAPGKRRTRLVVGAGLVALVLIGGGLWFALGADGDEPAAPVAKESPSVSVSADPGPTEDEPVEPSTEPAVPTPTGTGLQAVWQVSGSTLGLGEEHLDEPARVNAILTTTDGLDCEGRWQKDESGDFLEMALLCKEDGVRVEDKDRVGNLEQNGNTLTVEWKKGATGTETFQRVRDMDPA